MRTCGLLVALADVSAFWCFPDVGLLLAVVWHVNMCYVRFLRNTSLHHIYNICTNLVDYINLYMHLSLSFAMHLTQSHYLLATSRQATASSGPQPLPHCQPARAGCQVHVSCAENNSQAKWHPAHRELAQTRRCLSAGAQSKTPGLPPGTQCLQDAGVPYTLWHHRHTCPELALRGVPRQLTAPKGQRRWD